MFINRLVNLTGKHSFLLFGIRGSGKSALLEHCFHFKDNLYINLLDVTMEERYVSYPNQLIEQVEAMDASSSYVIIDEIQKVPKLLDVVHLLIENKKSKKHFILTGSSARKLKAGGANLLAGRAFVYSLFPFSFLEITEVFSLERALSFGMLPKIYLLETDDERRLFLQAYAQTYLKEEVWAEQLVRDLNPFRKFLEVAAQCNGKIINYSKIARDIGSDDKTVKNYFSILEDTLLGFVLEPFHHSFRKRLKSAPKFYFVDCGLARSLGRMLSMPLKSGTSYYGELFESFIVVEMIKLATYFFPDYRFSYLQTDSGAEVDIVVDRPGKKHLFIEIKSASQVVKEDLKNLIALSNDFGQCEAICFCCEPVKKKMANVMVYPWQEGIKKYFTGEAVAITL